MTKLTIKQFGQTKDINTKYGPKKKSAIKAAEYGENWLDYWLSPQTQDWKVGDTVEVEAVTPREYNGKTYYDIKMPKVDRRFPNGSNNSEILTKLGKIDFKLTQIINHLSGKERLDLTSAGTKIPDFSEVDDGLDQIKPEEVIF